MTAARLRSGVVPIPRIRRLPALLALGVTGQLAACAQPPPAPTAALPPNPYGYLRPAAVCDTPPVRANAAVPPTIAMTVGNDGGFCAARFAQPNGGGPFASFLVTEPPRHGDPLIYNYNGQTVVTYTPTTGYAGPDAMTVEFVPGPHETRSTLRIAITVHAVGVARS